MGAELMRPMCPRCKGSLRQDDSMAPPDWCCMMCGWRAEQRLKAVHPGLYLIYAVVGDDRLPMHWLFHHGSNGYRCTRHTQCQVQSRPAGVSMYRPG